MSNRDVASQAVFPGDDFFRRLAEVMARREPVVLVTVASTSGSAPGRPGAKMFVTRDSFLGTVGGGRLEMTALEHARSLLGAASGPEIVAYDTIQDLGMTCGGTMNLVYEPLTPPPRLVIFGAGHVAQPLCAMAALAGFAVTVCDERPDWVTAERFPDAAERILAPWEEAVTRARLDSHTFAVSVSPGHAVDERILGLVLRQSERPRYLGVIGSRRKGAVIKEHLVESGLDPETVETIRVPMGLNIGAADPREIAVSIVAELVAELRGVTRVEPW